MKTYYNLLKFLVLITLLSSCEKDLDINNNPNSATGSTVKPSLILPNALTVTAANTITYNTYASFLVGYQLPGRGISGYNDTYSYNFTSSSNNTLWNNVFTNLKDYQYIINNSETAPELVLFNAVAHIGKVYNYQRLVDTYGDVPYTEALKGSGNVAPRFDAGASVYEGLVAELDEAIAKIKSNSANAGTSVTALTSSSDVLFAGNLTKWIQFANNIKLRILVRAEGSSIGGFVTSAYQNFSAEGFLLEDAIVNPGYNASANQNPFWNTYHSSVTGSATTAATYFIPSKYVYTFYNGPVLTDIRRGELVYRNFPSTPTGQLGDETNNPGAIPTYSAWYTGSGSGLTATNTIGVLKSRSFGLAIFLASDIYFLLAEAALNGHELSGDAKTNFDKGILASFRYLETNGNNAIESGYDPESDAAAYQLENNTYLANYDLAGSKETRLEAIITQKYIASNLINSFESWSDFRRTGYPKIQANGTATTTFVSISSASTRPDKLPVRDIYPQTEYNLNPNTPVLSNAYTNPIFWDLN
ncbi:SusD/RagB family nutrient-binding outer membrane lipoprotein [Pedobacter sp. AW31-3R]|uniref:SusD/RagB family nutrient-binding outer membrane lipoprotein n=1 Tax=Pedobacter sp. AW31-3R TaxID=3445781 RepID=UPI003FA01D9A